MPQISESNAPSSRCRGGLPASLEAKLLLVHDSLQRIVRNIVLKSACQKWLEPDDLLQETLTRAFQKGRRLPFDNEAALLGWLARVARSCLLNMEAARAAQKRGGGRQAIELERVATSILHRFVASDTSPSRIVRRREILDAIRRVLLSLPAEYQRVLKYRFGSGHSVRETAQRMGRSEGAVKMLVQRALDKIRKSLEAAGFSSSGCVT